MVGDEVIVSEDGNVLNGYIGRIYEHGALGENISQIVFYDKDLRNCGPLPLYNKSFELVGKENMRRTKYNGNFIYDQKSFNESFASYSNYRKVKEEVESGEWFKKNFQLDWRRVGLFTLLLLGSCLSGYYCGLLCMVGAIAASALTIYFIRPKGVLEYIAANPSKEWKPIESENK